MKTQSEKIADQRFKDIKKSRKEQKLWLVIDHNGKAVVCLIGLDKCFPAIFFSKEDANKMKCKVEQENPKVECKIIKVYYD